MTLLQEEWIKKIILNSGCIDDVFSRINESMVLKSELLEKIRKYVERVRDMEIHGEGTELMKEQYFQAMDDVLDLIKE